MNPGADKVNLDIPKDGLYWIKSFYIEHAFRSQGVGRAAMDIVESMAASEPLCARTLGLDTVSTQTYYNLAESKGEERPKVGSYTHEGHHLLPLEKLIVDDRVLTRNGTRGEGMILFSKSTTYMNLLREKHTLK